MVEPTSTTFCGLLRLGLLIRKLCEGTFVLSYVSGRAAVLLRRRRPNADSPPRRGSPQGCPAPGTAPANKWCAGLRSEPHRATKPPRCAGASASTGVGQPVATTEVFSSPIPPHGKMPRGGPDIRPRKPKPGGVRGPNSQLGGDPRSSLGCPSKRLRSRFPPLLEIVFRSKSQNNPRERFGTCTSPTNKSSNLFGGIVIP